MKTLPRSALDRSTLALLLAGAALSGLIEWVALWRSRRRRHLPARTPR